MRGRDPATGRFSSIPVPVEQQLANVEAEMQTVDHEIEEIKQSLRRNNSPVLVMPNPEESESDPNAPVPIQLWIALGASIGWCIAELVNYWAR